MKPYGVPKDGQQDFTARARPVLAFGPRLQFEPFRRATIGTVTKRADGNINAAEQLGAEQARMNDLDMQALMLRVGHIIVKIDGHVPRWLKSAFHHTSALFSAAKLEDALAVTAGDKAPKKLGKIR